MFNFRHPVAVATKCNIQRKFTNFGSYTQRTLAKTTALSFKEKKMTKAPLPDSVRIGQVSLAVFQIVIFFLKSIFFIFGLKIVSAG